MKKSILIVGAGAVGQVYAWHFARAGHDVHLFLKPHHVAAAEQGFTLYHLNQDKRRQQPVTFRNFTCHSDWNTVAQQAWDQVWLCMSSTGLAQMDVTPMLAATGDATVVVLQPGPDDVQRLEDVAGERVVAGMINMISYHAPLTGEVVPREGTAFWIPPLIPMPVDGPRERADRLIDQLKASGLPAAYQPGFGRSNAHATAFLMTVLAALESQGWRYRGLSGDQALRRTMLAAFREASAALSAHDGSSSPLALRAVRSWMVPGLLAGSRCIAPLDMETYLQAHFSKVRSQTLALLELYVERARAHGLGHEALSVLLARMAGDTTVALAGEAQAG